jgi:hypothetical protein
MTPLSKYQLERADLITTIEQGRRVETELFAENSRNLQTMGELLKARLFGSTQWAISLRKRMTNYVESPEAERLRLADEARLRVSGGGPNYVQGTDKAGQTHPRDGMHPVVTSQSASPEPHQWPCGDPYCQPCDDAVKRLLRDVGVLPRKGRAK